MIKKSGPAAARDGSLQPAVLMVRMDDASKATLAKAAELRRVSVSDYVRQITLAQAEREVAAAAASRIVLTASEQLAFWEALTKPVELSDAKKELGQLLRGEA